MLDPLSEHLPPSFLPDRIARDPVEVEDRLDGLWTRLEFREGLLRPYRIAEHFEVGYGGVRVDMLAEAASVWAELARSARA